MKRLIRRLVFLFVFLSIPLSFLQVQGASSAPRVILLNADGAITPPMAEYIDRGLEEAVNQNAELVILQLNTPGGEVDVMNRIVQSIRQSPVPVVVYVSPRGSMAASAGTVVTLAGHAAAMAPETAIGAASPVGSQGEDIGETMESKVKEILKATVRSLAENRRPEAVALAEDTIQNAKAVSSTEALNIGLVDYIAVDVRDLLAQMDGKTLTTARGEVTLHTADAQVVEVQATFIEQLLQMLTNPNLVFLLLAIGVQAVLIELSNPGGWVPGFIGAVCLALAAYGLGVLPVNWFGILFILMSFILFFLEVKTPVHGALAAAGMGSFIIGALVLFNSPRVPSFQRVSVPLVIGTAVITGGFFMLIVGYALRALKIPGRMGTESLVGQIGTVQKEIHPHGMVRVGGELWSADAADEGETIEAEMRIRVIRVEGNHLFVRKV
jgi:membrane-bound serine protease (ClpP class)